MCTYTGEGKTKYLCVVCMRACAHAHRQKNEKKTNKKSLKLNGKDKFRHDNSCEVKTKVPILLIIWRMIQ